VAWIALGSLARSSEDGGSLILEELCRREFVAPKT